MSKIFQLPSISALFMLLLAFFALEAPRSVWGQSTVVPVQPGASAAPAATIQGWDPYSTTPQYGGFSQPAVGGAYGGGAPISSYPPPSSFPPPPSSPPPAFSGGPNSFFPQQPPPLYQPADPFCYPQQPQFPAIPYQRFLENIAFQYTYLPRLTDDATAVGVQDFDISATALFPDFLFSKQPLLVTPAFVLHLWDGPSTEVQDLPSKAYSAYLDLAWNPEITPRLFAELGFRIGAYTDFNTINTDSIRMQGLAVANVRVTPTMTVKAGVVYIDRLDIKLLPVVGVLYEPDSLTRFDITFPYPRLAKYWTTIGDKKVWWYVGGEYGGGSWTIHRYDFDDDETHGDQIDLNDYRVFFGLEATHPNRLRAFAEVGYVWKRDLIYRSQAVPDLSLDNTMMIRVGFNF